MWRRWREALIWVLLVAAAVPAASEGRISGPLSIRNYPRQEHGGHGQSWCAVQDQNGVLYFVKTPSEIRTFDGARWRGIDIPFANHSSRYLAVDQQGSLVLGSDLDVGVLAHDSRGLRHFVSLAGRFPAAQGEPRSWVRNVAFRGGFAIVARDRVFHLRGDQVTTLVERERADLEDAFAIGEDLLLVTSDRLELLSGESVRAIAGSAALAGKKIQAVVDGDGAAILFTRLSGLFQLDDTGVAALRTPATDWLLSAQVAHAVGLANGWYAVATRLSGVGFLDRDLRVVYVVDRGRGLINDKVHHLLRDRHQNLWAATDNGISHLVVRPYLYEMPADSGLTGTVRSLATFDGRLLVGTSNGCFVKQAGTVGVRARFEPLQYLPTVAWAMKAMGDALLVATSDGIFEIRIGADRDWRWAIPRRVSDAFCQSFLDLHQRPNLLLAGSSEGMHRLDMRGGSWQDSGTVRGLRGAQAGLFEGPDSEVLIEMLDDSQLLATLSGRPDEPSTIHARIRIDRGWHLGRVDHQIIRFDEGEAEVYQGLEAAASGAPFAAHPQLTALLAKLGGDAKRLHQGPDGRLWVIDNDRLVLTERRVDGSWIARATLAVADLRDLHHDPDNPQTYWLATKPGLFYFEPALAPTSDPEMVAQVRRVIVLGEERVVAGDGIAVDTADRPLQLSEQANDLRFEVAVPGHGEAAFDRYHYRLDGLDGAWSPWRREPVKEYARLPAGRYTFRVRATNRLGQTSTEARFHFEIAVPGSAAAAQSAAR